MTYYLILSISFDYVKNLLGNKMDTIMFSFLKNIADADKPNFVKFVLLLISLLTFQRKKCKEFILNLWRIYKKRFLRRTVLIITEKVNY